MRPQLLIIALLLIPLVTATTFIDAQSGKELTTGFVRTESVDGINEYLLTPEQPVLLSNETGSELLVLLRVNSSETYEYYAQLLPGSIPKAVILHPAGLAMGEVRDSTANLLVHAEVIFNCPSHQVWTTTDAGGHFRAFLPAESCTMSTASKGRAATEELLIEQGKVTLVTVTVNQTTSGLEEPEENSFPGFLFIFILLLLLVIIFHLAVRRPRRKESEKSETKKQEEFLAAAHRDALKTKERLIIDTLLMRDGKMKLSELRSATKIPRTSLIRTLEGLEQRNLLLKKEENGKKVIELTKK